MKESEALAAGLGDLAAGSHWPRLCGLPLASAVLRASPEDFEVEEISRITPEGEGAHWWLWVEKRGANTGWAADRLARAAGCRAADVGYAGMKDRHAVTRQWFSLPASGRETLEWSGWDIEGVRVLEAVRHPRKLQRGALAGNRFRLVLRSLEGDADEVEARLRRIAERGLPNYFGGQRFGRGGSNVRTGVQMLLDGRRLDRRMRGLCLSAVRSVLFNRVLAGRVEADNWDRLLPGDIAMLDGTHSVFACPEVGADLEARCAGFDLHPTGPLPGDGGMQPDGEAAALERAALDSCGALVESLARARVNAARRSLRVRPAGLEWSRDDGCLELGFELPAGAYATALVRELVSFDG